MRSRNLAYSLFPRMSVFVQICDAPRVLTEVLGEVLRRNQFDDAFKEVRRGTQYICIASTAYKADSCIHSMIRDSHV